MRTSKDRPKRDDDSANKHPVFFFNNEMQKEEVERGGDAKRGGVQTSKDRPKRDDDSADQHPVELGQPVLGKSK